MGFIDALLLRLGLVRIKRHNLVITPDGRLAPSPALADDEWFKPLPAAPIIAATPKRVPPPLPRAARGTEPVPRTDPAELMQSVDADASWELRLAAARQRAEAEHVANSAAETVAASPAAAPQTEPSDEEWEWKLAMAKARAQHPPS